MCGKCPWREPVGCLGVTDSPGAPGQLWSSQWVSDGGISVGIPQALLSKMLQGPLPLPETPPGSISQPRGRGRVGEMGPPLGQGWLISFTPPTQREAASILPKLWAWHSLTLAPGFCWVACRQFQEWKPHPGPGSSSSPAVSVTHHNRGLGPSG